MTKKLNLVFICLVLAFAAVHADQNAGGSEYRGFGGYAYESGMDAIANDMAASGYTLIDRTDGALWYDAKFLDISCELGYIFDDHLLIGGVMILESATEADFARVNHYLVVTYKTKAVVEIRGLLAVARMQGPDSEIVQTLDLAAQTHEIEYIYERKHAGR